MSDQPDYMQTPSALGGFMRRNPIALKELRGRMRGARAFIVLTVYVLLMSVFTLILYATYSASQAVTISTAGGVIGKLIFGVVLAVELFLVCFISPAFTAGAISGERERQTFDLLRTTLLPAGRIVRGKMLSALAYVFLLLAVAIPLQSLAFLMGGVTVTEVVLSVWILVVTAVLYAAVGIYFSSTTQRTLTASVLTYAFALVMTVGLPIATGVLASLTTAVQFSDQPGIELLLNYLLYATSALNPVSAAILTEINLLGGNGIFIFTESLSDGRTFPLVSPWIPFTVIYLLATFVIMRLSVQAIRKAGVNPEA